MTARRRFALVSFLLAAVAGLFGILSVAVFFMSAAIAMTIAATRRDPAEAATHRRVTSEA